MDKHELLWRMYEDHRLSARHFDEQRSKITDCMLVLTAAAVGLIKFGSMAGWVDIILASFIIMISVFGMVLISQRTGECNQQRNCAIDYKKKLHSEFKDVILEDSMPIKYGKYSSPWFYIHVAIGILGAALLLMVASKMVC